MKARHGRIAMAHDTSGGPSKERCGIRLPRPSLKGSITLEEAIARRRSVRDFTDRPLSLEEVGQLLWAAEGITGHASYLRAHPSAGGLHPLEVYLLDPDGIFHYEPGGHLLRPVRGDDQRGDLAKAAHRQWFIADAACVIAIAAVFGRTTRKYGDRGRMRYVPMDAAHAAQNVLLQAVALGLGAVPVGAFDDEAVRLVLGIPAAEVPLYLIPIGRPRGQS
ncbi:MAG: SagB/ThcOx family dehydrogenase [candidate division NC10 bacterium]|nr:SagB/ThcOx family dehydrogenase [candidate division NC10 bacterium]